jgi:TonB family protein
VTAEKDSTDILLWLGGAVLAGVALTWLIVSQPWADDADFQPTQSLADADNTPASAASGSEPDEELDAQTTGGGTKAAAIDAPEAALDSPLRMAELAVRAGMLIEPEGYSAWALYQQALRQQPGNAAARDGLRAVADLLMNRASVAIEQSRTADARRLIETVRAVIPDHGGAARLADELNLDEPRDQPPAAAVQVADVKTSPARQRQVARPTAKLEKPTIAPTARVSKPAPKATPSKPVRNDYETAAKAFETALAAGKLLAPEDASARFQLLQMAQLRPDDDRTAAARKALTDRLLARAEESIQAVDTVGADVWLTQADQLGADPLRTASARLKLEQKIIDRDAARPIPVSELNVLNYVAPRYPPRAVARDIEGWVDVEFTVNLEGQPRDITILDASHDRYFRKEAVDAVSQWVFEPRVVRGSAVAQRTSARITFKLQ